MNRSEAYRRVWASYTPEQRAERIRRSRAARDRGRPVKGRRIVLPQEPMEPTRLSAAMVRALQVACSRWIAFGLSANTIHRLCVAIILEGPLLEQVLLLLRGQVDRHEQTGATLRQLVELGDMLGERHELHPATVCEALALFVGLDPVVGIVLPPAPPTRAWVQ